MVAVKITPDGIATAIDIELDDLKTVIGDEYTVIHVPQTEAFPAFLIYYNQNTDVYNLIASQLSGGTEIYGNTVILMTDGNKPIDCTKDFRDGLTRKLLIYLKPRFVNLSQIKKKKSAHWIICSDGYYPFCSECLSEPPDGEMTDICPCCGARMKVNKFKI